jgi:hypothetical protein
MTNEIDPTTVETGDKFQVSDKTSEYFNHTGAAREIYMDEVVIELDISRDGCLVAFAWRQVSHL